MVLACSCFCPIKRVLKGIELLAIECRNYPHNSYSPHAAAVKVNKVVNALSPLKMTKHPCAAEWLIQQGGSATVVSAIQP